MNSPKKSNKKSGMEGKQGATQGTPMGKPADESLLDKLDFRFRALLYLQEVINTGSQSEAADNFNISQPALSQAINSLGEAWGVEIFEEKKRERVLTEAGRAISEFAREVSGKAWELKTWLDFQGEGKAGRLRVGMIDSANLHILPKALTKFANSYPQVELHLVVDSSRNLWEKLRDFDLDLAFVIHNPDLDEEFNIEEVVSQDLFLYTPKSVRPEALELETIPWALYPPHSQTRKLIDQGLYEEGLTPNVILDSGNPRVLSQMVRLGFACAVLPAEEADPKISGLKRQKIAERRLVAITRRTAFADERVRALVELSRWT